MRILIHTQYYPPEMGAPQARLSDLAKRLKALCHEIQILTAFPNYPTGRVFDGYPRFYMREEKGRDLYSPILDLTFQQPQFLPSLSQLSFV